MPKKPRLRDQKRDQKRGKGLSTLGDIENCRRSQSSSCGCHRLESRGIELSPAVETKRAGSDPDEGTRNGTKGRSR